MKHLNLIKSLTINLLLLVIAVVLLLPFQMINMPIVILKYWQNGFLKTLSGYFLETAADIDRFGNRNYRALWNLTLINDDGYPFGNISETISAVLGVNQHFGTLTKTGKVVCKILDFIDKDHCAKSAKHLLQLKSI
jgi:hypothetical protein